ncbi:PAS domain-containing sensor histidine kinase [Acinetobacter sp. c3-l95]|uniref:sensor histidine kinase n=1 Tax=Acinetobacter sp. c3-l95 TaxID=3342804 RepID=UPI0035B75437
MLDAAMIFDEQKNITYRLGRAYTQYRLLIAIGLSILQWLVLGTATIEDVHHPLIYFCVSAIYLFFCFIGLFVFKYYRKYATTQLFVYLLLDIIYISTILFLSSGPNLTIVLLYMIVVLAATLLLPKNSALFITLASIVVIVYQQFFITLFDSEKINFLGSSAILTLVFLTTHFIGQMAVKRLHHVEITALKQRREILKLQSINQSIIEQLDTGFMVIDDTGKIITVNASTQELLHVPVYEMHRHRMLVDIQSKLYMQLHQYLKVSKHGTFNYIDESQCVGVVIRYRPISTQQSQFTLLVFESLAKINQQAQQMKLASLGQLSASIAHEIRNPLAAIAQANELLIDDGLPEQNMLTSMIQRQCKRIDGIIEDTLNMSKQYNTMPIQINLKSWLSEFVHDDVSDIEKYLKFEVPHSIIIYFDPSQLRQVLINLIRNAIRHGHEKVPESKVTIKATQEQDIVFIDVIDQGNGVPDQQRANLFEPFHSTAVNGTGLGLYLSKTFCEANYAYLSYISQPQGGACFRIECICGKDAK